MIERPEAVKGTYEIAGPAVLTYREMLAAYRHAQGLGDAVWLPLPMALMKLGALAAEALPQKVFSRDTLRMLERGSVTAVNALPSLLARAPSTLAHGLAVTRPGAPCGWAHRRCRIRPANSAETACVNSR